MHRVTKCLWCRDNDQTILYWVRNPPMCAVDRLAGREFRSRHRFRPRRLHGSQNITATVWLWEGGDGFVVPAVRTPMLTMRGTDSSVE